VRVVPDMPCDRAGAKAERICLLPVYDGQGGSLLCDAQRRERCASISYVQGGERAIAGFAPAGTRWAEARVGGSNDVELVAVEHGVFGTAVTAGPGATVDVRFR
jgi:hypothetical protein